jgi:patatin-related protein
VIYGGVSLAVYINGVVQELLRIIRATSPATPNGSAPLVTDLKPSDRVYRMLGQALGSPTETPDEILRRLLDQPQSPEPIRTRFMVDILSGTSAGGINAVFLAKALANNCADLSQLAGMWLKQADILTLINDKRSLMGPLSKQDPPKSLLNSSRMYLLLLEALDEMDRGAPVDSPSPLVDKLDLFSTATDISGLRLPIALTDQVVDERRHRNVFHFQHPSLDGDGSDFKLDDNPFLAYAARCTSAFPFAFEPMALCDIFPVVQNSARHRNKPYCDPKTDYWQRYYVDYIGEGNPDRHNQPFQQRAFGDGGYLDNKPFSYAIEALGRTHSENPVIRKLIYIEPSPEHLRSVPPKDGDTDGRPDAIENSLAALISLPRYETIRQDLERILDRNRQVQRIRRAIEAVEEEVEVPLSGIDPTVWLKQKTGGSYTAYERLKIASVTDDLVDLVAKALEMDPRSGLGSAMRMLTDAWRERPNTSVDGSRQFLLDFDINYRLRRLRYSRPRINECHREPPSHLPPEQLADYRTELRRIKKELKAPHDRLQWLLERPRKGADLVQKSAPIPDEELRLIMAPEPLPARADAPPPPPDSLLGWPGLKSWPRALELSDWGSRQRARYVMIDRKRAALLDEIAESLRNEFIPVFTEAATRVNEILAEDPKLSPGAAAARDDVRQTYTSFERHDSAMFPIGYGSDLGGTDLVDVHRISPDDADARRAECPDHEHKLKGQALGAFAAFLDEGWRRNDKMWGRLDGAERLIEIALPGRDPDRVELRTRLIEMAHQAIVVETLDLPDAEHANWKRHLTRFLTPVDPAAAEAAALRRENALVRQQPAATLVAESAARATAVTGALLDAIAEKRGLYRKPFAVIAWTGRILWEFVEVSTPRSWRELFFVYWLQLLMLFAVLVTGIGAFATSTGMWRFGLGALGVLLVVHVARALLRRYLRGKPVLTSASVAVVTMVLIVAAAVLRANWATWLPAAYGLWQRVAGGIGGEGVDWTARIQPALEALRFGAALATVAGIVFAILTGRSVRAAGPASKRPVIDLELADSWADVEHAVGRPGHQARPRMARAVHADSALIAGYTLYFVCVGIAAGLHGNPLGWALAASGLAAGLADAVENRRMLALIRSNPPGLPLWPRRPSLVKWAAVGAAILLRIALWWQG